MNRETPRGWQLRVGLCVGLGVAAISAHLAEPTARSAEAENHSGASEEGPPDVQLAAASRVTLSPTRLAPEAPVEAVAPLQLRDLPEVDALVERAIRSHKTPGAVIIVGRRNGIVFRRAYGERVRVPEHVPMTEDTVFDLASLSKPLVVGTLVQWLIESGRLNLADRVAQYLPEFGVRGKQDLTVEQLLLHTSGLPPTNSLADYGHGSARALELTMRTWPEALPGRRFIYSDVGFIALGEMIERITGESLDVTAKRVIWEPLGMTDTYFCPTLCDDPRIAPTELMYGWTKSPIRGEVNDPRAYRLGGVAGNAGVFSTADDMARFARMLLAGGELDGKRILSTHAVSEFTLPRAVPGGTRTLAWDVSSDFSTARGKHLSERAYGHGGSTGTSLWIDPDLDLFVVFLSNRNHPYGRGRVLELQGAVTDAVVTALSSDGAMQADVEAEGTRPHASIPVALPLTGG